MENKLVQPIPQPEAQTTGPQATGATPAKPKSLFGNIMGAAEKMTGNPTKAKLLAFVFLITIFLFVILIIIVLIGGPRNRPTQPIIEPTPTPPPLPTPTPLPKDDIDKLIEDIQRLDPTQKDLQPPVVDLKISL